MLLLPCSAAVAGAGDAGVRSEVRVTTNRSEQRLDQTGSTCTWTQPTSVDGDKGDVQGGQEHERLAGGGIQLGPTPNEGGQRKREEGMCAVHGCQPRLPLPEQRLEQ